MKTLLIILTLCSMSFAQTTVLPKTTILPKTTLLISSGVTGGTLALAQEVRGRCANATSVTCVTTAVTVHTASTTGGNAMSLQIWDSNGSVVVPTAITGCASAWNLNPNSNTRQSSGPVGDISAATCLNLTGGLTSIVLTMSSAPSDITVIARERSCTGGTLSIDVSGSTNGGSSVSSIGTQLLTLTKKDSVDQMLAMSGSTTTSLTAPYNTNLQTTDTNGGGGLGPVATSRIENVTSDTAATWTFGVAEFPFTQAITTSCQ